MIVYREEPIRIPSRVFRFTLAFFFGAALWFIGHLVVVAFDDSRAIRAARVERNAAIVERWGSPPPGIDMPDWAEMNAARDLAGDSPR